MADLYVAPSSSGDASGSSRSNQKAFSSVNTDGWVRGNTYYLAEGTYSAEMVLSTANSGSTYITIKKDTYYSNQAVFTGLNVNSGYWDIDGVTGGGPGASGTIRTNFTTGHGIKFIGTSSPLLDFNDYDCEYIFMRHCEATFTGGRDSSSETTLVKSVKDDPSETYFSSGEGIRNSTFEYNYFHDIGACHFHTFAMSSVTIQYNAFVRNGENHAELHREAWSGVDDDNVTIRWNWFEDSTNTAVLAHVNGGTTTGCEVYGNIFVQTTLEGVHASLLMDIAGADASSNWKVYNNTIVGWRSGAPKISFATGSGNVVYNNIWAEHPVSDTLTIAGTRDYNGFYSIIHADTEEDQAAGLAGDETHGQVFSSSPFTNSATYDFSLSANTDAGTTLASPYNVDMRGNAYNQSGTWSRGALAYGTGKQGKFLGVDSDSFGKFLGIATANVNKILGYDF